MASFTPLVMRSMRPAPRFWPQYVAIATPMFSNTQVKRYLMRIEAVKAATQVVPRALLALCSMMMPMPVMENCKPIGTPLLSNMLVRLLSNRRSSPLGISICMCLRMYRTQRATERACDSHVAMPAPATPIPQPRMSTTSSRMFTTADVMRK